MTLITLRSNDQFNTTVYGYDDRFRGIEGTRMVVLMNAKDIARLSLSEGRMVAIRAVAADHVREVHGFRVTAYDPECNPLIPLWRHAKNSKVPAAKAIPVTLHT